MDVILVATKSILAMKESHPSNKNKKIVLLLEEKKKVENILLNKKHLSNWHNLDFQKVHYNSFMIVLPSSRPR